MVSVVLFPVTCITVTEFAFQFANAESGSANTATIIIPLRSLIKLEDSLHPSHGGLLYLDGNSGLQAPPLSVCLSGLTAICDWLDEQADEAEALLQQ